MQAAKLVVKSSIRERVAELKSETAAECKMKRVDLLNFLVEVIQTGAGKVRKTDRLCQGFKETEDCHEIRMPDKLAAAAQLAKLCGWNQPDKFEHGADDELTELLIKLRGGGCGEPPI